MILVAHRVNTVNELKTVPSEYGVEVDLRDQGGRIVLQHDPFLDGEDLETYLKAYHHKMLILNIKSERIEHKVLELLKQYKVGEYFFLDSSFPMIYALSQHNEHNLALRFSEFEGIDTLLSFKGRARWVWADCFTRFSLTASDYKKIKEAGFKLCLVSPELQGRPQEIAAYKKLVEGMPLDAVCTKAANFSVWQAA